MALALVGLFSIAYFPLPPPVLVGIAFICLSVFSYNVLQDSIVNFGVSYLYFISFQLLSNPIYRSNKLIGLY